MNRLGLVLARIGCGLLACAAVPAAAWSSSGRSVEGFDRAWMLAPAGLEVAAYANAGYRLKVVDGVVEVDVDAGPLASRSPFAPPTGPAEGAVAVLTRRVAMGATTRYEATSRVLDWVARNISYELDRGLSQESEVVLGRRTGYCTGLARLAVAMLAAIGIEAREVAGYVVADPASSLPAGLHRWIEVYYPDRGWVFSDPHHSHHFVPAQYLRLASGAVSANPGPALLLARENRLAVVDVYHAAPPGILARRNDGRQLAAALRVEVGVPDGGELVLAGGRSSWRASLEGDTWVATFVGLEPGEYRLRLLVDGQPRVDKWLHFRAPVRATLQLAGPQ